MTTAIVRRDAYRMQADLVAWHASDGLTLWHISAPGDVTRCGQPIPPPGSRYTRRHHPSAIVCRRCVGDTPGVPGRPRVLDLMAALVTSLKQNPAAAVTATGRGADAVEPGAGPKVRPAREGRKP